MYEYSVLAQKVNLDDFSRFLKSQVRLSVLLFEYTLFEEIFQCLIKYNIKVETLKLSIDSLYTPMKIAQEINLVFEAGLYKRLEFSLPKRYISMHKEKLKLLPGIKKILFLTRAEELRKWSYNL